MLRTREVHVFRRGARREGADLFNTFLTRFQCALHSGIGRRLALFQVYSCQRQATSHSPGFIAISCVRSIKIPGYAGIVTCVTPSIVLFSRRIVAIPSAYNPLVAMSAIRKTWRGLGGGDFTCGLRMLNSGMKQNFEGEKKRETLFMPTCNKFKFSRSSRGIFPLNAIEKVLRSLYVGEVLRENILYL